MHPGRPEAIVKPGSTCWKNAANGWETICVFVPCHAGCYHLEGVPSLSSGQVTMILQRYFTVGEAVIDWAQAARPVSSSDSPA
jgi:hypothetical protein